MNGHKIPPKSLVRCMMIVMNPSFALKATNNVQIVSYKVFSNYVYKVKCTDFLEHTYRDTDGKEHFVCT